MQFCKAVMEDLPELLEMYRRIVQEMERAGLDIWDEVYPFAYLQEDIRRRRLYLLKEEGKPAAAFALCAFHDGMSAVQWADPAARAYYIDRFGVDPARQRKGVGSLALQRAGEETVRQGAAYLRLFVVDINEPAIRLYRKNGFEQAEGVYMEEIEADIILREFGFEKSL